MAMWPDKNSTDWSDCSNFFANLTQRRVCNIPGSIMKSTALFKGMAYSILYMLSFTMLCLTSGCDKSNNIQTRCENDGNPQTGIINFTLIGQGDLYGNGIENIPKQNVIITNQGDWTALINAMNTNNNNSDSFTEVNIDFHCYQILAVFDNVKLYTGYSIDITEVAATENEIIVTVQNLLTGGVNPAITQPFHIVKISKSSKEIVFIAGE
jgi:hypothetical protein